MVRLRRSLDRDIKRLIYPQVAGESGLGKTTFINTLFSTTIKNYADHRRRHAKQVDKTVEIEITKAELEEKFFKGTMIMRTDLTGRFCNAG